MSNFPQQALSLSIPGGDLVVPAGRAVVPNMAPVSPSAPVNANTQYCCVGCALNTAGSATCPATACATGYENFLAPQCAGTVAKHCGAVAKQACSSVAGATASRCSGYGAQATQPGCVAFLEGVPQLADELKQQVCDANPELYECAAMKPETSPWASPISANKTFAQVEASVRATYTDDVANAIMDNSACWWWPGQGGAGMLGGSGAFVTDAMRQTVKGCTTASLCASAVSNVASVCPNGAKTCAQPVDPVVIRQMCDVNYVPQFTWSLGLINATNSTVCFSGANAATVAPKTAVLKSTKIVAGFTENVNGVAVTEVSGAGPTMRAPLVKKPDVQADPCPVTSCAVKPPSTCDSPLHLRTARCGTRWYLAAFATQVDAAAWVAQLGAYACDSSQPMPMPAGVTAPLTWLWRVVNLSAATVWERASDGGTPQSVAQGVAQSERMYADPAPFTLAVAPGSNMSGMLRVAPPQGGQSAPTAVIGAGNAWGATAVVATLGHTVVGAVFGSGAQAAAYAAQAQARGSTEPLLRPEDAAPPVADTWTVRVANTLAGKVVVSAPGQPDTTLLPQQYVAFPHVKDGSVVKATLLSGTVVSTGPLALPSGSVQTVVTRPIGAQGAYVALYRNANLLMSPDPNTYITYAQSVPIPGDAGLVPLPQNLDSVAIGSKGGGGGGGGGGEGEAGG